MNQLLWLLRDEEGHSVDCYGIAAGALRAELELAVTDKDLDPAERDAALSMCLISGGDGGVSTACALRAIYHDHSYTQLPPLPHCPSRGLSLAEVAAAAELILGEADEEEEQKKRQRRRRKKTSVDDEGKCILTSV